MQTATIASNIVVGGIGFISRISREGEGEISHVVVLPAGVAGAISATGVDGLATGHGIAQGSTIDIHWLDPADGTPKCSRGAVVDTSTQNEITFDNNPAKLGDALPANGTVCVVSTQVVVTSAWAGSDIDMLAVQSTGQGMCDFWTSSASALAVPTSAEAYYWASGPGLTSPLDGDDIVKIVLSNGTVVASSFKIGLLYQSVE